MRSRHFAKGGSRTVIPAKDFVTKHCDNVAHFRMNSGENFCGPVALCEPKMEIKEEGPNSSDCLSLHESSRGQPSSLSGDSEGTSLGTFRSKNNEAVRKSRAKKKQKVVEAKERLKKADEEVVELKDKLYNATLICNTLNT